MSARVPRAATVAVPPRSRVAGHLVEGVRYERVGDHPVVHVWGRDEHGRDRLTVLVATRETWAAIGTELIRRARDDDWEMPDPEDVA